MAGITAAAVLLAASVTCLFPQTVMLPSPEDDSGMTLVEALETRRSVRDYTDAPVTLEQLARLLQSAQGITCQRGYRSAPSAGATYPMTLYVVSENVAGLQPAIYIFDPFEMSLDPLREGEYLQELAGAALGQRCIDRAALAIVMVADYSVTTDIYGDRGVMYVHMEAGHISQNIYLQAAALELGTVAVGAFLDDEVSAVLGLDEGSTPLYIMPVGGL
jgi:SagB-type dehydrogenase family enzyme